MNNNKILQSVLAGIVGTIVMTVIMMIAPMMGMPKMNPAAMLSVTMGFPIAMGWVMHFIIGIIFALSYSYVFLPILKKVENNILKGAIFGFAIFVFAQIMMQIMGTIMGGMPQPENMALTIIGSILGHVIFGVVVSLIVKGEPVKAN